MAAEPSSRTKLVQVTAAEGGRYPLPDGPALDAYSRVVTEVARTLAPSVANLRVRHRRALGGGSAFVIAPDGYLVTSAHVVEGGGSGRASFTDGRDARFTVVGADPLSDLAVLRTDDRDLVPARLGAPRTSSSASTAGPCATSATASG